MDIPTVVNYEILLSELVFLQQQWVVPRKTPAGLAVLPLETSESTFKLCDLKKPFLIHKIVISIDKLVREKATRFADFFQISKRKDLAVVKVDQDFIFVKLQRLNLNMEIQCRVSSFLCYISLTGY